MPSIKDDINSPIKTMLIGEPGAGKTGSLASLVASGYNLRIIDTDKGVRTLRSLLTDPRYPYADLIKAKGIDLQQAVRYVPIDTSMELRTVTVKGANGKTTSDTLLSPKNAHAWIKMVNLLQHWKDDELDLGSVTTWGLNDILVFDSFSTLAKCAYYFSQSMNGRLGARDQGFDYQRDIGEAQSQLTRLLELLYDSNVGCHVIVITHITWVDETRGVAGRPQTGETVVASPKGYPSAIGRALSPQMGKYFNDVFVATSSGTGLAVRRNISTVPHEGITAKNSAFLNRDYPVSTGMAEIYASLRGLPPPTDLLEAVRLKAAPSTRIDPRPAPVALASA